MLYAASLIEAVGWTVYAALDGGSHLNAGSLGCTEVADRVATQNANVFHLYRWAETEQNIA